MSDKFYTHLDAITKDKRTITTEEGTVYINASDGVFPISYSIEFTATALRKVERIVEFYAETIPLVNPGDICKAFIPRVAALPNSVGLTICNPGVGLTAAGGTINWTATVLGF